MKKIVCLAFIILILLPPRAIAAAETGGAESRAFLAGYVQTLFGEDSVIPMSEMKDILQTGDGYLYFAGYQGLMRYNGIESRIFGPEDGLPSFKINVLYEDSRGRLWIGTNDGGAVLYDKNIFTVYGIDSGMPSASVRGISETENGVMFIATANGIAIINEDGEVTPHPGLEEVFAVDIVGIGIDTWHLCLLNDGSMAILNGAKVVHRYGAEYFGGSQPSAVFMSRAEEIFIGTTGGEIYVLGCEPDSYKNYFFRTSEGKPYFTNKELSTPWRIIKTDLQNHAGFYEDASGRVWVYADNGVGYLSGDSCVVIEGLFIDSRIECVYEDYERNFWIGSSQSGLLQLTRGKFFNVGFAAGLPNLIVNTTAIFNRDLYVGTETGLVILRGSEKIENGLTKMLAGIRIKSILVDSKNRMWICTFEKYGVLLVKEDGSVVSINDETGLADNRARCAIETLNGDIYVGLSGGVSVIRDEEVLKNYTRADGLSNDVILSLIENGGVVYAGSDGGGIYAITEVGVLNNYSERNGLASGVILRMANDAKGIWVSTGNALCRMDDATPGAFRVIDKFPVQDDSVFDMKIIGGEIWFIRSRGVSVCEIGNLLSDDELIIRNYRRRDGLSATVTANSWNALANDGTIYICAATGVFGINVFALSSGLVAPVLKISEVCADGKSIFAENGAVTVKSGVKRVDITIALLSYASADGTIFYMLEGFDREIQADDRVNMPRVSYTNLNGGKYVFHLYGTNGDGVMGEPVFLTIQKEYGFTEMPYVRILFGFIVIGAVASVVMFYISIRTRGLMKQRQEYRETAGFIMKVAATMSDLKIKTMEGHSRRVAAYARMIGKRLGMDEDELETLYYSALLHDIGEVAIPDLILNKNGPLTESEYKVVKDHVSVGGDLLKGITVMGDIAAGVMYHHERIDGKGYQIGLKGDEIPTVAKIICVCNALDRMLTDQPYRRAMPLGKAQSEFIKNAGTQFDENITAVLISLIHEGAIPVTV